jgi:glyoxylase-like metal-dependent hydrolase (beta-lactamase superfamily II)
LIAYSRRLGKDRFLHQYRGKASNQYILEDQKAGSSFLIDCGLPSDAKGLTQALKGMPPLKRVVCTHFHVDHVSGWNQLKKDFTAVELWLNKKAAPLVKGTETIPFPGFNAWKKILLPCMRESGYLPGLDDIFNGGFYGTPFKRGFPEDRVHYFSGGINILPGFETIPTPGHRPDHVAYFNPDSGALISGDFIIVIRGRIVPNSFLVSEKDQRVSLNTIKSTPGITSIWPGHGMVRSFDYQVVNP